MKIILPNLPYRYDSLEPFIDEKTMYIHHTKHHQSYVNNANSVLENLLEFSNFTVEEIIKSLSKVPINTMFQLRNNLGGHINHSLFWNGLKIGTELNNRLKQEIENNFSSFNRFKSKFEEIAMSRFGSGWIWLVNKNNKLTLVTTANQDNPLMGEQISGSSGYPIFGLDLWEHAYYLKYQNRKLDYVKSFWNIVNWDEAYIRFKRSIFKV